ncbi:hypothetical protein M9H77_17807 [Catharanthus roseus]|uniref:Uncharacterized protein n=1 Tax=Catharanthus roseus TaxID=4058 RepID=A0ACC0B5N1_CATRO|nr:hypothetical protein M9H77_17807 [Catharanthus roseus]
MATCENCQLFVHDGRHNHAIGVYTHGHAQAAKLTEAQLIQTVGCSVNAHKIYNVVAKIKKNRMQGRNTIEEIKHLYFSNAMSTENQQDEKRLMPVIDDVFSKAHHMLCRSHLPVKKIWLEISRAAEIIDDPRNKYGHYIRTSHGLPCSCESITRLDHILPIQLVDIEAFWKTLEIVGCHPSARQYDMDSKMCSLTDLLHQIST